MLLYDPKNTWSNLEKAHRMGVSWAQIWTIIGGVAFIAIVGIAIAIFMGKQNTKMAEEQLNKIIQNIETSGGGPQANIQYTVDQKLLEAGILRVEQASTTGEK